MGNHHYPYLKAPFRSGHIDETGVPRVDRFGDALGNRLKQRLPVTSQRRAGSLGGYLSDYFRVPLTTELYFLPSINPPEILFDGVGATLVSCDASPSEVVHGSS